MQLFLAAPFTQMLSPAGEFDGTFRSELMELHDYLGHLGYHVFSAHSREDWGNALDTPGGALAIDLAQIDRCDALIAVIGDPPSPGVQLELGYAIARKKPLVLIVDRSGAAPYLVAGIPALTPATIIHVTTLAESHEIVRTALRPLDPAKRADAPRDRGRAASHRGRARHSG
jgi:Nucleoside 2-deoxyribosyltransferase